MALFENVGYIDPASGQIAGNPSDQGRQYLVAVQTGDVATQQAIQRDVAAQNAVDEGRASGFGPVIRVAAGALIGGAVVGGLVGVGAGATAGETVAADTFVGDLPLAGEELAYTEPFVGDLPLASEPPMVEPGGAVDMGQTAGVFDYQSPPSTYLSDAKDLLNYGVKGAALYQQVKTAQKLLSGGGGVAVPSSGATNKLVAPHPSPYNLTAPESRLTAMGPGSNVVPKNSAPIGSGPIAALAAVALVVGVAYYAR